MCVLSALGSKGLEPPYYSILFCSNILRNQHWNSFQNKSLLPKIWRRGRVLTIAIRLWDGRCGFRIAGEVKGFFFPLLFTTSRPALGPHLASFTMGTGANSRGKAFGVTHIDSAPRFRMSGTVLCFPPCLQGVDGNNFAFSLYCFISLSCT